jgi:hypothetical protein
LVRSGQDGGDVGDCIAGLAVSDLHASSPGGRPGMAWWAAGPGGRRVVVFAGPVGPTPTTVSAWRPARCLVVLGTAFAIPVNRYSREFETVQSGSPFSTGCQLRRRCQRRNWRVRAVERGQRSEPVWLRAHPGLHYFEPEKPPRTQIPRSVWDMETAGTGDGVNYNSERNLAKRKLAPLSQPSSKFLHPELPGSSAPIRVCLPSPKARVSSFSYIILTNTYCLLNCRRILYQ